MWLYCKQGSLSFGDWQHVVVTWTGTTSASEVLVYVDGNEVSSYDAVTNGVGTRNEIDGTPLLVDNSNNGGRTFDGSIDDVRIFNRALTADEVQQLYNLGR